MTNHTDTSRIADLRFQVSEKMPINHSDLSCLFDRIEALEAQIDRLASFIMHCIEGEPSQSQGAVDTAIRIMTEQATTIGEQLAEVERLREVLRGVTPPTHFGESEQSKAWWAKTRAALGEG